HLFLFCFAGRPVACLDEGSLFSSSFHPRTGEETVPTTPSFLHCCRSGWVGRDLVEAVGGNHIPHLLPTDNFSPAYLGQVLLKKHGVLAMGMCICKRVL